jgi:hypothetical protein
MVLIIPSSLHYLLLLYYSFFDWADIAETTKAMAKFSVPILTTLPTHSGRKPSPAPNETA